MTASYSFPSSPKPPACVRPTRPCRLTVGLVRGKSVTYYAFSLAGAPSKAALALTRRRRERSSRNELQVAIDGSTHPKLN